MGERTGEPNRRATVEGGGGRGEYDYMEWMVITASMLVT